MLRRYERLAYEKLIRMLSHEVNNSAGAAGSLLHSCLNYAPQLRAGDREDFEDALRVVITRTEHLSSFMKGFADVVRLPPPRRLHSPTCARCSRASSPFGCPPPLRGASSGGGSSKDAGPDLPGPRPDRAGLREPVEERDRSGGTRRAHHPAPRPEGPAALPWRSKTAAPAFPRRRETTSSLPSSPPSREDRAWD